MQDMCKVIFNKCHANLQTAIQSADLEEIIEYC